MSVPGQGNLRKRRTKAPTMTGAGDSTVIRYSTLGSTLETGAGVSAAATLRLYVPGNSTSIANGVGPDIVNFYSTGVFRPGTSIRWEPSVSFTQSGRVYCGFTDNPEAATVYNAFSTNQRLAFIKGLGSMRSFPIWQETTIPFPTGTRRKKFDTNADINFESVDQLDRSMQTAFVYAVEGVAASTTFGSFWYHDVVDVEGVQPVSV